MSEPSTIGFTDAARRLGVPLNVLRRAIRTGRVPAPPHLGALAAVPAAWLTSVEEKVKASPGALSRSLPQAVPPFARYEGTSAWRKYTVRVREFGHYKAALAVR